MRRIGIILTAVCLVLICIPLVLMVRTAFADPAALINQGEFRFSLEHLRHVLEAGRLWQPLRKSLTVALSTAVLSVLIAAPGAYVIAKLPGRPGMIALLALFATRAVPEVGVALPITLRFVKLGLFDTDAGLVMAHLVRVLPLVAWILVGTFQSIPRDLERAARMDGCSRLGVLRRVVFPVAKPGIAVGLIFGFLNSWDEFIYASYLCLQNKTLPLTVYYYADRGGWFLSSMYSLIITIPVIACTYVFQRRLQAGFTAGAVKG